MNNPDFVTGHAAFVPTSDPLPEEPDNFSAVDMTNVSISRFEALLVERDRLSEENIMLYAALGEIRSALKNPFRLTSDVPDILERVNAGEFKDGAAAIAAVIARRRAQNAKWVQQDHEPVLWSAILTEECGEFAQAALETRLGGPNASKLRDEAVDVAAVAVQIIESIDRGGNAPIDNAQEAA